MDDYTDLQNNQIPMQQYPHYGYKPVRSNAFMILSLCLGILCITSCSVIFISMIAGGLSILFAILSRGNDKKMQILPKIGIAASVFGLICSVCVTASVCYLLVSDSTYREQVNEACKQVYGMSFDDMLEEMYPELSGLTEESTGKNDAGDNSLQPENTP